MLLASLLILAQTDVLDVGVALTMDQRRVIHNARILLAEGNILAIGTQSEIPLPESVGSWWQYENAFAFPGGVDLHSHVQTGSWGDINDMVHPDNPELRVLDTIVPWNRDYQDASASGVTTVNGIPGSGTNMGGAGTLLKVKPSDSVAAAVLRHPGSVKVAQGYNPERDMDLGASRAGMWWMLRHYLDRAREVAESDRTDQHPELFSIAGIFEGWHPFLVHTAGARDTYGTVRMFALEAGVPVVVSHGSFHGYMAGEAIAQTGAALNIGPRNIDHSFNKQNRIVGLVQAYEAAGNTNISVQTDSPVIPQEEFFFQATLAERFGCSTWEALESINSDPACQILAADRIGQLRPGLDADIVVKAGQPLDPSSPVLLTLVDGEVTYDIREGQRY